MWETQQRQSMLLSCQLLSRSSPSWPSATTGGSLSPRRETPHRCQDASCSISTYFCFTPTTFSCCGFPAWHCSPLAHFHALSFGQVRGGRGCQRSPRAQGQAPGGHCPIEPARGGSGGLCSPHEKPIQVFLLPCTSRRGNAKPTGMKGTFCGAAHPAGRGTRAGVRLAKGRHPHLAPSAWVSPLGDTVFLGQSLGAPFRVCSLLTPCFRVSQHCPSSLLLIFELIF